MNSKKSGEQRFEKLIEKIKQRLVKFYVDLWRKVLLKK